MAHRLALYWDANQTKSVESLDFGEVDALSSGQLVFYLRNHSDKWPVTDIEVQISDREIEVEGLPKILKPDQVVKCKLVWKPTLNRDEPLDFTKIITGRLRIGRQ